MCGVFGYIGQSTAVVPLVADALRQMEYRGYDSWGIGWDDGTRIKLVRKTGRVPQQIGESAIASIAIGHTRWATHGAVTEFNAHPHTDELQQIAVVHNGMIENADDLKTEFLTHVSFRSETDSEIVPHLIRHFLEKGDAFPNAVQSAFLSLKGSSAIVAMDRSSEMIVAITARSPLRLGRRTDGWELASDPVACARSSSEVAVIPDHHLVILTKDAAKLVDVHQGTEVSLEWEPTPEEIETHLGDFSHFTLKEIHDQVDVLTELSSRIEDATPMTDAIRNHRHVILAGCGSALYAASLGAGWLRGATDIWIDVVPASEMNAQTSNLGPDTLVIAFTQSGETADVVDAINTARVWGASIGTIINTETSTIARMADVVLPIRAGVERSVLATKSFLAMAMRTYQISLLLKSQNSSEITPVVSAIKEVLANRWIPAIAQWISDADSMIVLGKGLGRAVASEAALKIKEGSYVHAEAFLMGELKHGPLALVSEGTPCLIFATNHEEMASAKLAAAEVFSRGGYVVGIGDWEFENCDEVIHIDVGSDASSLVHVVAAQLLAYYIATERDVDPDFPRNLAKSVTVR